MERLQIEGAGLTTEVVALGSGPPLILLHGVGPGMDATLNWGGIMPRLAERFRCLAIDLAGFGRTSLPDPLPQGAAAWMALRTRQVEAVMNALEASPAMVIGNSRGGGALVLQMLLDSPHRISGAVLMGAAGFAMQDRPRLESARETLIKSFYDDPSIDRMAAIVPLFFHNAASLPMPLDDLVHRRFAQATRPGAAGAYQAMTQGGLPAAPSSRDALRAIDCPIMLVHGAEDLISEPANSLALQQNLRGAILHILPCAGHWSHVDQPDLFVKLVKMFADGVVAPGIGAFRSDEES